MDVFAFYWFCCQFFKQLLLSLIPNPFILRHPLICLRNIKWHCIGRAFVVLRHAITKYIFRCLDKQWYQCSIDLITYNITAVLSIIAWHFIRNHHFVYIDCKCIFTFDSKVISGPVRFHLDKFATFSLTKLVTFLLSKGHNFVPTSNTINKAIISRREFQAKNSSGIVCP